MLGLNLFIVFMDCFLIKFTDVIHTNKEGCKPPFKYENMQLASKPGLAQLFPRRTSGYDCSSKLNIDRWVSGHQNVL